MSLESLGWNSERQSQLSPWLPSGGEPARVVGLDRDRFTVLDAADRESFAELAGRLRRDSADAGDTIAVGDWVVLARAEHEGARRILARLPRTSAIARGDAGEATRAQVLAANVDAAFLVAGLDHDFNLRRLERYLATAYEGGVTPVVVLNKADCAGGDLEARVAEAESVAPGVPVVAISALEGAGLDALAPWLGRGRTVVMLGSSGVGKSTIANALLGEERQKTGAVREHDSRGRHTTTRREMLPLPSGAWLIDTPGLRLLKLWADEEALAESFAEITALASNCRFRDCGHAGEPGCAVLAAVAGGVLAADRLESWRKLQRELRWLAGRQDRRLRAEQQARWRGIARANRQRTQADPRNRAPRGRP